MRYARAGSELASPEDTVRLTKSGRLHLRRMARRLIDVATSQPDLLGDRAFLDSIETEFVEGMVAATARGRRGETRPMARVRQRALQKAIESVITGAATPEEAAAQAIEETQ